MRKSKIRAALFLIHLRIELALSSRGWLEYMCLTKASDYWVDTLGRGLAIKTLNQSFVSMKLGGGSYSGEGSCGYIPVAKVLHKYEGNGLAGSREIEARKELFQHWKKNLMETGL